MDSAIFHCLEAMATGTGMDTDMGMDMATAIMSGKGIQLDKRQFNSWCIGENMFFFMNTIGVPFMDILVLLH